MGAEEVGVNAMLDFSATDGDKNGVLFLLHEKAIQSIRDTP
jgi:hypothetical protein